ncbi:MAG TPA: GGDEF domain-containing protein [Beijerinckiaceae bacterium]
MTGSDARSDDLRTEMGALRTEVERLASELAEMRAHATSLESLAHEDPLTGLLNRRGFERDLARAVAYRARYGTPAALLLFDLDGFKPINDAHGHQAGDEALKHVAEVLRRNVRASDSIGRLGGDEFALILWHAAEDVAALKASSLLALIATPVTLGPARVDLGASVGVTALEKGDTPAEAIARADRAMYAHKSERAALRR